MPARHGDIVAKLKFWFGADTPHLFNDKKYYVEISEDKQYVQIYKRVTP